MQTFGMRFLRLGSGRSRAAAGVREGTRLDAMRRRLPAADYLEGDMATPYKECPHCGAHLDSGEKCECREEEIEAKNSQKYACGLTEQDVESGWECPLDNPNETVERCEDCAFAKETD